MGKNMKANLKINYEKGTGKGANPLIFGHFIEFMRDCIDGGMWAQLLDNRGFDRKKEMPEGVWRQDGIVQGERMPLISLWMGIILWLRTDFHRKSCVTMTMTVMWGLRRIGFT